MYARDHALIATPIGPAPIEGAGETKIRIDLGSEISVRQGETDIVREAEEQICACLYRNFNNFYLNDPATSQKLLDHEQRHL
ncbi:hypothetical protein DAH66_16520 [Sphingomonas koreensis]|uniref:Uncharacterized protein n=1 Tax=Sphingomonas koreensis TaxID=93064 RepID=A0A430G0K3_9SPHN|nr:hypothetical protein [Sphingomonas koreensis]RSY79952.1 hypothetical protein DAH66_16520 [Sphingomonas koreensis]